jgi:hypothetical protein
MALALLNESLVLFLLHASAAAPLLQGLAPM